MIDAAWVKTIVEREIEKYEAELRDPQVSSFGDVVAAATAIARLNATAEGRAEVNLVRWVDAVLEFRRVGDFTEFEQRRAVYLVFHGWADCAVGYRSEHRSESAFGWLMQWLDAQLPPEAEDLTVA